MIFNIIIVGYVVLMIWSMLLQITLIGKKREPMTAGEVITNIILATLFLIGLYFKLLN